MTNRFLVLISILGVAACGGGGGGNTFETPEDDVRTLTGSSAPLETAASMEARAPSIISRSDSLIMSTIHGETSHADVPTFRLFSDCSGTQCRIRSAELGINIDVSIDDFYFVAPTKTFTLSKHGITLIGSESDLGKAYGSWMQHSGFQVTSSSTTVNGISITEREAIVGGDLTGYSPNFSASWRGVMVGTPATGTNKGDILQGDASLNYGFNASDYAEIDAAFTNIKNIDKNRSHSVESIRFDDVPVYVGGTFEAGLPGNRIQGGFYGPSYVEAAGVFEQQNVVGAFGAKKR